MADRPRGLWRVWVARVRPGRTEAFEVFAQTVSRPMFEAHAGCEAVHVLALEGEHRAVLTRWRDADAVIALHLSPRYAATVRTLEEAGVVAAASPALLFPATGDVAAFIRRTAQQIERAVAQLQSVAGAAADPGTRASLTPGSQHAVVCFRRSSTARASSERPPRSSRAAAAIPPTLVPR